MRLITYSFVGLLNGQLEVFNFLLLLCGALYLIFLCVVGNNTENQDAAKELQPMGACTT